MAKERLIVCECYTHEGGPCLGNPNKNCAFRTSMQKCRSYRPLEGAKPIKGDTKRTKLKRAEKRDSRMNEW